MENEKPIIRNQKPAYRNQKKILLVTGYWLLVTLFLFTAGTAQAVAVPAKSVVNPLTQTLYVPNNSATPEIFVYKRNEGSPGPYGWGSSPDVKLSLPAKCYGLAVSQDGKSLFASISNGASSALRIYALDSQGLPSGSPVDATGWTPESTSAPRRIVVLPSRVYLVGSISAPQGFAVLPSMAYLADSGSKKIHIFTLDASDNKWKYSSSIGGESDLSGIYDIAATQNLLFVSRKTTTGKIFVYKLELGLPPSSPTSTIENIKTPTYLKIADNKLFVSVNGDNGEDIKVYDILETTPYYQYRATIKSGVTGAFGWTGFDITPDGKTLFFTQAQDASETTTKLYQVNNVDTISGTVNATFVSDIPRSDGLVVSPDRKRLAVTYSGNGTINNQATGLTEIAPVVTSIAPTSTTYGTSVEVTISGKYFLSTAKPSLAYNASNYELSNIQVLSSTTLKASVDAGSVFSKVPNQTRPYNVKVKNDTSSIGGGSPSGQLLNAFTINRLNYIPNAPTNLKQYRADTMTEIPSGGSLNYSNITFKFSMSDLNNPETLTPQVKLDSGSWISGEAKTFTGGYVIGTVTINNIPEGSHNWEARVVDAEGLISSAVAFSGSPDFIIDQTPPQVSVTTPESGAKEVAKGSNITITFNENDTMDASSITSSNFTIQETYKYLTATYTQYLTKEVTYNSATKTATLNPGADFHYGATVEVTAKSGSTGIKDKAGNQLDGNKNGVGGDSYVFTFEVEPDTAPPGQITALTAQAGDKQVTLNWINPSDPDFAGALVLRRTNSNFTSDPVKGKLYSAGQTLSDGSLVICSSNLSSWTDTNVLNGYIYYYRAYAYDYSLNYSPSSEIVNAAPWSTAVKVKYPDGGETLIIDSKPPISWEADASITSVSIWYTKCYKEPYGTGGTTWIQITSSTPNDGSYEGWTVPNFPTTEARVRVRDVSDSNKFDISDANFTISPPPDTTGPITIITAPAEGATVSGTTVNLQATINDSTTGNSNIAAAEYYIDDPNSTAYPMSISPNSPNEFATASWDSTLFTDGPHTILIRGQDAAGNWGAPASVNVTVDNIPADPTINRVYPNKAVAGTAVNIVIEGTNFIDPITKAIVGTTNLENVNRISNTRIEAKVPQSLTAGTYDIRISTSGGQTPNTSADDFTVIAADTDTDPPARVQNANATAISETQIDLSWTNPGDADLYLIVVRRSTTTYPQTITEGDAVDVSSAVGLVPTPGAEVKFSDTTGLEPGKTYYYSIFAVDTSGNPNDKLDPAVIEDQNAAKATTLGGVVITVTDPSIMRDGDTAGTSTVTISWRTNPTLHATVKIYYKTGDFSTTVADWTEIPVEEYNNGSIVEDGDRNKWTDDIDPLHLVGTGTHVYYKVIPATKTNLEPSDLTSDVVGKFDFNLVEGSNLISLPFIPPNITDINTVIGNQLTGGTPITADKVKYFDASSGGWPTAVLKTDGTWTGSLTDIEPDKAYYINIELGHDPKIVTMVGNLYFGNSRNLNLYQGTNMIGTTYPVPVDLNASNLNSVLTGGMPLTADKVLTYDATSGQWPQAILKSDNTFMGSLTQFEPGKGYIINNQALINDPDPDTWNYTRP